MAMGGQRRFVVVDDHPLYRDALVRALAGDEVTEAADLGQLMRLLSADPGFELVLLDLNVPGADGFSGLLALRSRFPQVPVLIISASEDEALAGRSLALGASGYLGKSARADEIAAAVEAVLAGGIWRGGAGRPAPADPADKRRLSSLTAQQARVLLMMSSGLMNKQIAYELGISDATVKAHVSAILQKLGVDSRTQAVILARSADRGQLDRLASGSP